MTYDIMEHAPGCGAYGTDWRQVGPARPRKIAIELAQRLAKDSGRKVMVFTHGRVLGRLVFECGPY